MTDLLERKREARAKADATTNPDDRKAAFLEWSELHGEVNETIDEAMRRGIEEGAAYAAEHGAPPITRLERNAIQSIVDGALDGFQGDGAPETTMDALTAVAQSVAHRIASQPLERKVLGAAYLDNVVGDNHGGWRSSGLLWDAADAVIATLSPYAPQHFTEEMELDK